MSRTSIRLTALFLAVLFFATSAKEALGLGCPHHDLAPPGATTETPGAPHTAEHSDTTVPGGSHTRHSYHYPGAQHIDLTADHPDPDSGPCTCLGNCNGATTTPPPSADSVRLIAFATEFTAVVPETGAELTAPTPYLLPFATAPPLDR